MPAAPVVQPAANNAPFIFSSIISVLGSGTNVNGGAETSSVPTPVTTPPISLLDPNNNVCGVSNFTQTRVVGGNPARLSI